MVRNRKSEHVATMISEIPQNNDDYDKTLEMNRKFMMEKDQENTHSKKQKVTNRR